MDISGTPEPVGVIASSADRMVGMEHSEVRYFTRYGSRWLELIHSLMLTIWAIATIIMVNGLKILATV